MRRGFRVILMTLGCSSFGNLLSDLNLMTGSPLIRMVAHPFFLAFEMLGAGLGDLQGSVAVRARRSGPSYVGVLEVRAVGLVYFAGNAF